METQETPDAGNEQDPLWRPRAGSGKWRRSLETVERDQRAAQLASKGWTYDAIAAEMDFANRAGAYRAAQRAMYTTACEDGTTEQLRRQQAEELRQVRQRMWAVLDDPPPAISRTGTITMGRFPGRLPITVRHLRWGFGRRPVPPPRDGGEATAGRPPGRGR